ncbi:hypothetical protein QA804_06550 [Streptomyces scabiei]
MRIVRWGAALGLGALWWWGVLRLALVPDAGAVEGAVAAGGWGLSLLPVHCVPKGRAPGRPGARQGARGVVRFWRTRWGPRSPGHGHPAVRAENLTRRERRGVGGEMQHGVRDVLGLADPAQR